MHAKDWTGVASVPRWYGVAVALFFGIRSISTLAAGASFAVPGDGWRSVFQLVVVAIAAVGIVNPRATRVTIAAVAVIYLLVTASQLVNGTVLLGAIPVDMRDHVVHPLIAVLGVIALLIGRLGDRRQAVAVRP